MKLQDKYSQYSQLHKDGFVFDPEEKIFYTENKKTFKAPKEHEHWTVEQYKPLDYYQERMKELGVSDEDNSIELIDEQGIYQSKIFQPNKFGDIEIIQFGLNRKVHEKKRDAKRMMNCAQIRLHPLREAVCAGKYDFSDALNVPFWSPMLIEAFENETPIKNLFITEGQFKAFKACKEGMATVGLTSISHFKDSKTQTLHPEIIDFMRRCQVENVFILWDADCRNISSKSVLQETPQELTKRPNLFYTFAVKIKELIYDFSTPKQLKVHFATIKDNDKGSKGIDDLLIDFSAKSVVEDAIQLHERPSIFFTAINLSNEAGIKKMRAFFNLAGVLNFYDFHKKIIKEKSFYFFSNLYSIEKGQPCLEATAEIRDYKLIGTELYRLIDVPVSTEKKDDVDTEKKLIPWKWETFVLQHGKDNKHLVEKFLGFCNIPSHTEYQQIVKGHWNLYYDVDHKLEEGEWPTIEEMFRHAWGEQYEMGLDYITILYRYPTEKLPIPVLLSKLQGTGKSTFVNFMKKIFKQNMIIVSNADLTNDFNAHWISKLIVACEETLLEKKEAKEKLKSLSTQLMVTRNEKNKSQTDIQNNIHFFLCSNHEDDFMRLEDEDRRFWIRKVPKLKKQDYKTLEKIDNELPAFLHFINNREIITEQTGQLWFSPEQIKTDAFYNIVNHSIPTVVKEVREVVTNMMLTHGVEEVKLTANDLKKYFSIRGEVNYINKSIREHFEVERTNSTSYNFFADGTTGNGDALRIYAKGRPFIFRAENLLTEKELEQCRNVRLDLDQEPTQTHDDLLDEIIND